MAEFHNITVTNDGMKLISLASAMQKPIVFDRMDIGDSRPADASKVASLTAVVSKRIEATISDIRVVTNADVSEARYRILGKYSNSTLTTGFKLSEVGVIAHVESNYYQDSGWNGYAGENLLFGYFMRMMGKKTGCRPKIRPWTICRWAPILRSAMPPALLSTSTKKTTLAAPISTPI